ncbi:hypothetical protein FNV43_RR02661 [Rhamnella rubrinervis]|uniref:F-box associated beta-propeller type 3 domain-containing protein n=1 Tax=Rhamnella rubrinervis TaxID=2594499 RepID=A0A8K0MTV7_9ROSA|nr:hypothetical protein FNV43_RR02661 [Rhamnella rubrinervis]
MAADSCLPVPADIMAEILSRTSLETVGNCRLLSKQVKMITDHPSVAKLLRERTKTLSGFLLQESYLEIKKAFVSMTDDNPELSHLCLDFLPANPVKILASTKSGILLCSSATSSQYYMCNPTTKKWREIPNPPHHNNSDKYIRVFAIEVVRLIPLRYKIVVLSLLNSSTSYKHHNLFFDMFDSETWTWKNMGDVVMRFREMLTYNPQKATLLFKPLVSANGKFYSYLLPNNEVFGFSLEDESWEFFALPLWFSTHDMVLVEYEGRLGLLCIVSEKECMELWVNDDDENGESIWRRVHKVSIQKILNENWTVDPVGLCNSDIALLINGEGQLIFHKFQDCCFFKVKLDRWYCFPDLFPFQSDIKEPETDLICTTPTRDDPLH